MSSWMRALTAVSYPSCFYLHIHAHTYVYIYIYLHIHTCIRLLSCLICWVSTTRHTPNTSHVKCHVLCHIVFREVICIVSILFQLMTPYSAHHIEHIASLCISHSLSVCGYKCIYIYIGLCIYCLSRYMPIYRDVCI